MIRVLGCITEQHDIRLVVLAAVICAFGCYTALSILARARAASGSRVHWQWLTAAAAVAGAGVWTTHFVAMLAYQPGLVMGYDLGLTALSIVIAFCVTWAAFAVALRLGRPAWGGAAFGAAVAGMHYTGMAALSVPAHFAWNLPYVLASIVIGVGLGALALTLFARGSDLGRRLQATGAMALAIAAMHFTAMSALTLEFDPLVAMATGAVLAPEWLAIAVTAVMGMIVVSGLSGAAVDHHLALRSAREADRLRAHIAELESTKRELEATTANLQSVLEAAAAASQSKSQFLATMSHELRTPLNAIIGFSEMLSKEIFGPHSSPRYKDYAATVHDSGRHLLELINDVLDFSKIDAGRLELQEDAIDLRESVGSVMRMIDGQAEAAGIELQEAIAADLPWLRADQRRVRQIILNLVSNAVKFTPRGGQVCVAASLSETGVAVTVSDTGIGIAPEDIPRALERFGQIDSSLSRRYEGTGLGLPLAKRLVELHGGTLAIESAVGVGTTVTALFPSERIVEALVAA